MKRRTYKLNDSNRLQLLTKPLSLLYEIGFIDYRSRFHFSLPGNIHTDSHTGVRAQWDAFLTHLAQQVVHADE